MEDPCEAEFQDENVVAGTSADAVEVGLRKSSRERKRTEKAQQNLDEEIDRRGNLLKSAYEQWRQCAYQIRKCMLIQQTVEQLQKLQEDLERRQHAVMKAYNELRDITVPRREFVSKVDNCGSLTSQLEENLTRRRLEIPEDFVASEERWKMRGIKHYHPSIFGDSVSAYTSVRSALSDRPSVVELRAKAEVERAEKIEAAKALEEEQIQRSRLMRLQNELEEEKMKLETLHAKAAVRVAEAKSKALVQVTDEIDGRSMTLNPLANCFEPSATQNNENTQNSVFLAPDGGSTQVHNVDATGSPPKNELTMLAKVFADSVAANRLPVPVPRVFDGNSLQFIDFERSFQTLIENKGILPAEKLYYLKQYVSGPARDAVEGYFFGTTEEAYQGAWQTLRTRFGQSFKIRQAFRDRLEKWPKIGAKDSQALQKFADFLKGCLDAIPYVEGLAILNDCLENQKLLNKLPEWLVNKWNRVATESLDSSAKYPQFSEFVSFLLKEARIANNPISSVSVIKGQEQTDKTKQNDCQRAKRPVGTSFAIKASDDSVQEGHGRKQSDSTDRKKVDRPCHMCSKTDHNLARCPEFVAKTLQDRKTFIKENGLCYGCLNKGHRVQECRRKQKCEKCSKRHPTLLHEERIEAQTVLSHNAQESHEESATSHTLHLDENNSTSMIVPVWVSSEQTPSSEVLTYALLDTQSDSSFISEEVAQSLQVEAHPVKLKLSTMVSSSTIECKALSNLLVRGMNSPTQIKIERCYTQEVIAADRSHIPTRATAQKWRHLQTIAEEIPMLQGCEIGMLIGYNCPQALAPKKTILGNEFEPYAVYTVLGWSIVGGCQSRLDYHGHCHRVATKEVPHLTPAVILEALEADFSEQSHNDKTLSQEDVQFLNCLKDNIAKDTDGHLVMPLPFKCSPELSGSRKLAVIRLKHLQRKLEADEKYKEQYESFMRETIDHYAEKVPQNANESRPCYYIPHHGVYHPKKDKIRVVFDCSARCEGTSLNDYLLKGPDLTNGLIAVLCRFRQHQVALMCDVEKMFYQFRVAESDRDYLRFLWWQDGDTGKDPVEYRMKVHLFGAASSPGCANFGLRYLAEQCTNDLPLGSKFVGRNFYVDDGLISLTSTAEGIQLVNEAVDLCKRGGLRLHKFVSNDRAVMEAIPPSERATDMKSLDVNLHDPPLERVLGITWNVTADTFNFKVNLQKKPFTRRGILSVVASLYDPLGLVAPVTLCGKKILQEMCRSGVKWDDEISDELRPRWERWCSELSQLERIEVPRCYYPADFGEIHQTELHHFSDASTTGYGQCSYLRFVNQDGNVHCALVFAKARVAPTKVVTVPRLELTAAVVSVKVSSMLKTELEYKNIQEFFWTDSQVVLGYINNEARRFHTFVANRVELIRQRTMPEQWNYVNTADNPADYASRGLSISQFSMSDWFKGPRFLWERELHFPYVQLEVNASDPEVKSCMLVRKQDIAHPLLTRLEKFSSWQLVCKVVARLLRRAAGSTSGDASTIEERHKAAKLLVKTLQRERFETEMSTMIRGAELPTTNRLHSLDPILVDGILRVGGRLRNASSSFEVRHPVILPKDAHITNLVISYYHSQTKHSGKGMTLNTMRANGFWVINGVKVISSFIFKCVECRRKRRPVEEQRMADLPVDRVTATAPFTHTGMDCFGPILVKQDRKQHKRYGVIFTCKSSRAVHIETVDDMSTDCFLNGLRCFIALRGPVASLHSDQGSNFIGAAGELAEALKELDPAKVQSYMSDQQCVFEFNPPHASHFGGIWERQIRTVKGILTTMLREAAGRLDTSSLRTLLYEVSYIVNSRPLTTDSLSDPTAVEPLTPNHILTMKSSTAAPPPGNFVRQDLYIKRRWRQVQYLCEQFWSRWKKEYLTNIQLRSKWHKRRRNLQIGDIVLLKEEETLRSTWPLARVIDTTVDDDGLVRKVKVMLPASLNHKGQRHSQPTILDRPIQKLVLLLED